MNPVAPLTLISSMATRELLRDLALRYEHDTGRHVITEAAGGVDVAQRVHDGAIVDVVVLASGAIDKLLTEQKLLAASRLDLAVSGIAVAVPAGGPRPALDTEEDVKRAVLAARTLSYSTGPSGVYLEKLFARWGVLDELRERIVVPPPGVAVGSLVAGGIVELGFQQLSELQHLAGIDVVGNLPASVQSLTTFSGAIGAQCLDIDAARHFLAAMAAPATAALKRRHGMEPP